MITSVSKEECNAAIFGLLNTIFKVFFEEFTRKWILVAEERNAFILHHQQRHHDVTCKVAIKIAHNFSLLFRLVFLQP